MTWLPASVEKNKGHIHFSKNTGDTLNFFIPHISFEVYINC